LTARRTEPVDRAFAANVLGTLALTLADRMGTATAAAARHGAHAPAALVTLLWYPDRPVGFLADRLRVSHPGAVQLVDRLERDGLVERVPGEDGRTRLLFLTTEGARTAREVLAERRRAVDTALGAVPDDDLGAVVDAVAEMLVALTDDLRTSEHMCRLCDEQACPDDRCPVEHAEPAPPHRRGRGYGVTRSAGTPG
jgi:MarR family transcriptional regulator, negative regulator of the multidrug operon emrRAB